MKNKQDTATTDKKSDANNNDSVEKATIVTSSTDHKKNSDYPNSDEQDRKLFIGYPAQSDIDEATFTEFFGKFGTVDKVIIKRDQMTQKPRGFGFLTMSKAEEVQKILSVCPIDIKGKHVECKLAISRPITKKIFVGGIDSNLTRDSIMNYFTSFGKVEDLELPVDRAKKKRREFCFVIFETEEAANFASKQPKQIIHGRECDVKKATPQPIAQQQKRQNLQQSFNSSQSNQHTNLNHSRNTRNPYFSSPSSVKSNGSYDQRNFRKNTFNPNFPFMNGGGPYSGHRKIHPEKDHYRASGLQYGCPPNGNHVKPYGACKPADKNSHNRNHNNNSHNNTGYKQQMNQNYPAYDQMTPQSGYYGFQMAAPYDYYPLQHQNYQAHPQNAANTQAYMPSNQIEYFQFYQQCYQNPAAMQNPQYAANQCYTNYQAANSIDNNTVIQPQPSTSATDAYQSLDEHYYAEQQKYDTELINNPTGYEKFDAQEPTAGYGVQPVNTNLLNVQQYQSSIPQC